MARERPARHADGSHAAVGKSFRTDMTGRARNRAIGGEALVVKQRLAERALGLGIGIGRRKRDRGGTAEFLLQRRKIITLRESRDATNKRSAQERRGNQSTNRGLRPSRPAHINLPMESSMRDTSLSTVA